MATTINLKKAFPIISFVILALALLIYFFNTDAPDISDMEIEIDMSSSSSRSQTSEKISAPDSIYLSFGQSVMKVSAETGALPTDLTITKVHGNTKTDKPNPTIVYEIYRVGGKQGYQTMKYGISSRDNYKTKPGNARPQSQARRANRLKGFVIDAPYKFGLTDRTARGYGYRILTVAPTRNAALDIEYALVEAYYYSHGNQYPPWQTLPKIH